MASRRNDSPELSVVTPLYNCLHHTKAMLESLASSLPRGLSHEVILVDDGSSDGTREWIAGLGAPYRVLLNERNLGFGGATNRGAAAARGRTLVLLNNDLFLPRGWLQPMQRVLGALGPRAGLVGNVQLDAASRQVDHAGIFINLKGKPEHLREDPGLCRSLLFPIRPVAAVTGACVLVRRQTWQLLGGFDEAYVNGCEDVDLCLRARAAGLVNAVALRSRVLHHVSASPGRKRRDEENTRRLVLEWRDEIARIGSRGWARTLFLPLLPEPRDYPDKLDAWRTALYLAHLTGEPPRSALAVMNLAIDGELARWRKMFSD